jgi:hypothetical protein
VLLFLLLLLLLMLATKLLPRASPPLAGAGAPATAGSFDVMSRVCVCLCGGVWTRLSLSLNLYAGLMVSMVLVCSSDSSLCVCVVCRA